MNKEPQNIKLDLDNSTIIRFWLILFAILGTLSLVYWARQALVIVGLSVFLAVAINPLVTRLSQTKLFHQRRAQAALLAYLTLAVIVILAVVLILPALVEQLSTIVKNIPEAINNSLDALSKTKIFENWDVAQLKTSLSGLFDAKKQSWLELLSGSLVNGIGSAVTSIFSIILTFVISLMLSIELPSIKQYVFSFYRDKKQKAHHQGLLTRMYAVIVGFVSGQMMVALINAAIGSLVIFILSYLFPLPQGMIVLFGLILLLGAVIPMFGSTIGMLISALFIVLYSWQAALIFVLYYLIYQQIEGNVIGPMIQSKRVDLSALLILISITLGTFMFGILGGVIAIPLAACLKILVEDYIINSRH